MSNDEHIAMLDLQKEIDRLNKVLKLTAMECLAGGFCRGLPHRPGIPLDKHERNMLETAGKCIARILNQQEAEEAQTKIRAERPLG